MRFLKTNTAVIITVGPFYDATDGVTIEGSLTISNERITLTADTDAGSAPTNILDNVTGATSATDNDLNYITGNDAGMMQLELSAANVNRFGRMYLSITDAANHVPVFHEFMVLPAVIYDAFILGSDTFDVNVTSMADIDAPATWKASINSEVDTALSSTNYNEPAQGAMGVNISIEEKISYIYMCLRNEARATATLITIRNDANSGDVIKRTISDDGTTYTEEEFVTGV